MSDRKQYKRDWYLKNKERIEKARKKYLQTPEAKLKIKERYLKNRERILSTHKRRYKEDADYRKRIDGYRKKYLNKQRAKKDKLRNKIIEFSNLLDSGSENISLLIEYWKEIREEIIRKCIK